MAFGRERARTYRAFGTRAFLTVVSLFATAALTTPARAQEASEPANMIALDGVDFTDRTSPFTALETRERPLLNLRGNTRTEDTTHTASAEAEDDEIVVTARREENFAVTPHPDFVADPFERAGITTNYNPENAGLEPFPIRRDDIEGWRGVDVDLLNTGRFSIEAQVKRGAGFEFTYHFGRD